MIDAVDTDYHAPIAGDPEWAEVLSLGFCVPEKKLNVRTYTLFRKQFGVAQTSVTMVSRDALTPWQANYADFRSHAPAPNSLHTFKLINGLSLETITPHQKWMLRFQDKGSDVYFEVECTAIGSPYSPFDSKQNPLFRSYPNGIGHFEQSVRATGSLHLNGQDIEINSWTIKNHGWGPRRDRQISAVANVSGICWLHAHFSDGSAIFGNWVFDISNPYGFKLMYGYALKNGKVVGLSSGTAKAYYDNDNYPIKIKLNVIDAEGKTYALTSRSLHRSIWSAWPNVMSKCVFAEWTTDDQRIGHGDILQFTNIHDMIEETHQTV